MHRVVESLFTHNNFFELFHVILSNFNFYLTVVSNSFTDKITIAIRIKEQQQQQNTKTQSHILRKGIKKCQITTIVSMKKKASFAS